jgi:hypothetical protein
LLARQADDREPDSWLNRARIRLQDYVHARVGDAEFDPLGSIHVEPGAAVSQSRAD